MVHATSLKRFSAVSLAAALLSAAPGARAQDTDLTRSNQDELASFYGRMNVVVGSGARAFGMGGAFLARADDATAASWNPAGLSYLRRTEFSLVGAHNDFSQRIPRANEAITPTRLVTTLDQLQGSVADFAGFAYPLRLKGRTGAVQVSYQRSFSFAGKRSSQATVGQPGFLPNGKLLLDEGFAVVGRGGFDSLSVSSGFEVHQGVRLGLSVNRWINGFSQTVTRPDREIYSSWKISGTNVNFGALFTPVPKLNLGAVWKTPFGADVRLFKLRTDTFQDPEDPLTGVKPPARKESIWESGDVRIRFPRVYGVGASFRATNTLTVSADFTRTAWSKATITDFFSLATVGASVQVDHYGTLPFPAVEAANGQAETTQVRVGAEWVLRLGQSGETLVPLRAGFFRDGQPVTIRVANPSGDPAAEAVTRRPTFTGLTAGVGITVGGVLFDLAYIRETGEVPTSVTYGGVSHYDSTRVRYNRVFASMIVRLGQRH